MRVCVFLQCFLNAINLISAGHSKGDFPIITCYFSKYLFRSIISYSQNCKDCDPSHIYCESRRKLPSYVPVKLYVLYGVRLVRTRSGTFGVSGRCSAFIFR